MLVLGAALAVVSLAYAGNGGFAPETPHSPNAGRINDACAGVYAEVVRPGRISVSDVVRLAP